MIQNDNNPNGLGHFRGSEWDNGRFGVQSWLEGTAWRALKETDYGRPVTGADPHPALFDDPLLRKVYLLDLALFVAAERTSYLAVSKMIHFAPDESSQVQLGTQVLDECRHYEVFCRRMYDLGVGPEKREQLVKRHTPPAMRKFYDLIHEQVDRQDFVASSLAQNVILEGMAYPAYRYEIKYWSRLDPGLSHTIRGAFADESLHVGFGEAILRVLLERSDDQQRARVHRLSREFHQLMTEAFEEIIKFYIGLYQECANSYKEVVGDVEIFPGRKLGNTSEEEQTRLLLKQIQDEYCRRATRIGIPLA